MYQLCRHIKTNGLRCQSPAMHTSAYCYFHTRMIKAAKTPVSFMDTIQLPPLEDRASILLAITQVLNALLGSRIDDRRARVLLYALQIASQNLKGIEKEQDKEPPETVREVEHTEDGEDLAPVLSVCEPHDCALCPQREQCRNPLDSIPEAPPRKPVRSAHLPRATSHRRTNGRTS
jgi:hypothetical protein